MELLLKKYFWVVHVLVISVCAILLARGVNHVLEAKYLIGSAKAVAAAASPPSKDAQAVIDRNVFCSACLPPTPVASTAAAPGDPNHPPLTSLPLVLMATSVARDEALSSATVANTQLGKSGSY